MYIGRCTVPLEINREEIVDWRWVSPEALEAELAGAAAGNFTPWFRLEWERTWGEHRAAVLALSQARE